MTAITIPLSEDRLARLQELAGRIGISPEELARAGLEDWLAQLREDFRGCRPRSAKERRALPPASLMRYLTLDEVLELHQLCLEQSGGAEGVRVLGLLESAVAQPLMTFEGMELYPTVVDKAMAQNG